MRDGHRMEDENELPYLVQEKRDDDYHSRPSGHYDISENNETDEETLFRILDPMDLSIIQHMKLYNKLIAFLNAKDCTSLNVEGEFGEYIFKFTRENEYVKTTDEFLYYPIFGDLKRVFKDYYTSHNHDRLIANPRFQSLIRATGLEFIKCDGGYVTEYSIAHDEITMKDEIDIGVWFKAGSKKRNYKLDLDRMELSRDYFEYRI